MLGVVVLFGDEQVALFHPAALDSLAETLTTDICGEGVTRNMKHETGTGTRER